MQSPVTPPTQTTPATTPSPAEVPQDGKGQDVAGDSEEVINLKLMVQDLQEKLETLRMKRAEDKTKLKEAEKMRIQFQQVSWWKNLFLSVRKLRMVETYSSKTLSRPSA